MNDILIDRALEDSANFIEPHLSQALLIRRGDQIRAHAMERVPSAGLILEFGVSKGAGVNQFAALLRKRGDRRTVYGFDAFLGLSEDWYGKSIAARTNFSRQGKPPRVDPQVDLVIGWVEETLGPFLERHADPIAFAHIDTDTYSPCRHILDLIKPRLAAGSLILFDEHHGYPNWRNGEYKALKEVLDPETYRYRAFCAQEALVEIT
ncbi:MAG: class I SAM-dependent methyltransferase [Pseudomonadota bacterium]